MRRVSLVAGLHWELSVLCGSLACTLTACSNGSDRLSHSHASELPALARSALVDEESYVAIADAAGRWALAVSGNASPIMVSGSDFAGVARAAKDLQADVQRVTGVEPKLLTDELPSGSNAIIVGTLGKNSVIDRLVTDGKLDVSGVTGRWESAVIQSVDAPVPGVQKALVIAGSDKRGAIYGIYDLSAQMGVSPWYYWADVPTRKSSSLYISPGRHVLSEPVVKYRGIFVNDENPALLGWVQKNFGDFNHSFYANVFELLLRLRGNMLWPAQWGKAFNDDDTQNAKLADEYGIVMATAHNEPMMRAEDEWRRYGQGDWNYATNGDVFRKYWADGIRRMGTYESIITVGMRGNGDARLSPNPDIPLVQTIVADQRQIIADVTGKPIETVPQVWTLYKEVQDYYDQGMRVPDDVTMILADDNYGNLRKLPKVEDTLHPGGFGIYYHFDYVGSPRSYKWLNTNPLPRIWEQLHLAHSFGANKIWIVNVGDIKPMELPIEFFFDYAWNPDKWPIERANQYTRLWAERQFGAEHAARIGEMLAQYPKLNARRKPELLSPTTYSQVNYREADRIVAEYNKLASEAQQLYDSISSEYKDAFYQLVLHPIKACANLNDLYVSAGKNALYAKQGRAMTNELAARVRDLFAKDAELTDTYNEVMADGKWNHMMDQPHIGYTSWQEPADNTMPAVNELTLPEAAEMAVAVEGSDSFWLASTSAATLPELSPYQLQAAEYIDIFNRGSTPFEFKVDSPESFVTITPSQGSVDKEQRIWVSVDWQQAPAGTSKVPLTITGPNNDDVVVQAVVNKPDGPDPNAFDGFVESNGYLAMDAEQYTNLVEGGTRADAGAESDASVDSEPVWWQVIDDLSRTKSGMTTFPVTAPSETPNSDTPRLEYRVYLFNTGQLKISAYLSPTLNFHVQGLRYAISFDDNEPLVVDMHTDTSNGTWQGRVADNINIVVSTLKVDSPGEHVLKFWRVDAGVVLQKIVVSTKGTLKPSYLGPPTERFEEPPPLPPVTLGNGTAGVVTDPGAPGLRSEADVAGSLASGDAQVKGGGCGCRIARRATGDGAVWMLLSAIMLRRLRRRNRIARTRPSAQAPAACLALLKSTRPLRRPS